MSIKWTSTGFKTLKNEGQEVERGRESAPVVILSIYHVSVLIQLNCFKTLEKGKSCVFKN